MTKPILAAVSGVAFGLVLAVSSYHFYLHMGCSRFAPPAVSTSVVHVRSVPVRPCQAVESPQLVIVNVEMPAVDVDTQAERNLAEARRLAKSDPQEARELCRKTMQLYHNNPRNLRVRSAFKLLNSIPNRDDSDF
jgi:hypothetical protein